MEKPLIPVVLISFFVLLGVAVFEHLPYERQNTPKRTSQPSIYHQPSLKSGWNCSGAAGTLWRSCLLLGRSSRLPAHGQAFRLPHQYFGRIVSASVILQHLRISSLTSVLTSVRENRSAQGRRSVCSRFRCARGKSLEPKHYSSREVAIIGGSAAGMFTAHLLARRGARVQVFEGAGQLDLVLGRSSLRPKCSRQWGRQASRRFTNEIRRFELFTDGRVAEIALRSSRTWWWNVPKLISCLANQARARRAQILLGRRFLGMQSECRQLELSVERKEDGRIEVVGAQTVGRRRWRGQQSGPGGGMAKQSTVPLLQAIVRLPRGMRVDTTRVWFIPEDTPYFYWLIPQSPVQGALGLIGENGVQTRRVLDRFLEKHHLEPLEFQAARIPLYTGWIPVRRKLPSGKFTSWGMQPAT